VCSVPFVRLVLTLFPADSAKQKVPSPRREEQFVSCFAFSPYTLNPSRVGLRQDDVVLIRNCPPVSKLKRFALERIIKSPETIRDAEREQKKVAALASGSKVLQALSQEA